MGFMIVDVVSDIWEGAGIDSDVAFEIVIH